MSTIENGSEPGNNSRDPLVETPAKQNNGAMAGEFHSFITDVEDLIKAATSLTGEDLDEARAKLNARILGARESVENMTEAISVQARSTARMTNSYVHENPWQAVGIGAGAGLLLGMVIARR